MIHSDGQSWMVLSGGTQNKMKSWGHLSFCFKPHGQVVHVEVAKSKVISG